MLNSLAIWELSLADAVNHDPTTEGARIYYNRVADFDQVVLRMQYNLDRIIEVIPCFGADFWLPGPRFEECAYRFYCPASNGVDYITETRVLTPDQVGWGELFCLRVRATLVGGSGLVYAYLELSRRAGNGR